MAEIRPFVKHQTMQREGSKIAALPMMFITEEASEGSGAASAVLP